MIDLERDDVVDQVPPRFESHADRAAYLLAEYKIPIVIAVLAYLALVATGRMSVPGLPPWTSFVLEAIAVGSIPAAIVSKVVIVDPWIPDPRYDVLVIEDENGLAPRPKATPRNTWERRHDGEFQPWEPPVGPFDYVVTRYEYLEDVDELVVEGVNPEIANPLSIIARNGMLEEIYDDLQYTAAEFERYKQRERTRRRQYDKQHVNALVAAFEHALEFNPGTLEAIQKDDQEFLEDLEQENDETLDQERSDEQEDRPTLNQMLEGSTQQAAATDGGEEPWENL